MECEDLVKVHHRLEELHEILTNMLPMSVLDVHPFTHFKEKMKSIHMAIDQVIEDAENDYSVMKLRNTELISKIKRYSADIGIEVNVSGMLPCNLCVAENLLNNEISKIMVLRGKLEDDIRILSNEVTEIRDWIGDGGEEGEVEEISIDRLNRLKGDLKRLRSKKKDLEESRESLYEEIKKNGGILGEDVCFSYEETIHELESKARMGREKLCKNERRFSEMTEGIVKIEEILKVERRVFPADYSDDNIRRLEEYYGYLKTEQKRLFLEIYERTGEELREICTIFGIPLVEYSVDDEGLNRMIGRINELRPKKELFCDIIGLIEKRKLFIEKMTEFEKIASDPRRLFKSSFQLNSEEKFRNTAYPSLLSLEKSIFALIDKYEKTFDKFIFEGNQYRNILKSEIDNRIINRTVFISRCESPYKKRK